MLSKSQPCDEYFLMEVFSILYLGVDEVPPEKQIGTIKLVSSLGFQYLYKVEEADIRNLSLHYGDDIPLIAKGPIFGASNEAYLEFDLFCGAYKGTMDISWNHVAHQVSLRRVLFTSYEGTGRMLVNIGNFANATTANVEVKLLSGNDNSAVTNVSGVVFASNSGLEAADCTSVLFSEKPDNGGIKVGLDGVISLSKFFVGVPLDSNLYVEVSVKVNGHDCTGKVSFDAKEKGLDKGFIAKEKEPMIHIKVTWCDDVRDLIFRICDENIYGQRKITPWSVDGSSFEVEKVALEFHLLKDQIIKNSGEKASFHLPGITSNILSEVIYYRNHVHPSDSENNFDVKVFKQLDLVTLFNLIQAANHFQIKGLMDLTCQTLANKVKGLETKPVGQFIKEFNVNIDNIKSVKCLKRTCSKEDMQDSIKDSGSLNVGNIFRQRGIETFINKSVLVDEPISPLATKRLAMFEKSKPNFDHCFSYFMDTVNCHTGDPMKLLDATRWLKSLIAEDAGFADYLSNDAVKILLQILDMDKSGVGDIQSLAIHILSYALSRVRFNMYLKDAVPSLVTLLSNSSIDLKLNIAVVIALTRVADACSTCIPVMLEHNVLEKVQRIANCIPCDSELIECVAKFLAVICYRNFPHDKIKEALTISETLLQIHTLTDRHIFYTFYALQYLTYGRHVPIEGEALEKLIVSLRAYISFCFTFNDTATSCFEPMKSEYIMVAGSALGVVGNIARWGHPNQIQALATDSTLFKYFGNILCCKLPKFSKEACQIISNIGARKQTWIEYMRKNNLVEPLCNLLEKDMYESDVKMEAAWAIFNGIYNGRCQQIDLYPR